MSRGYAVNKKNAGVMSADGRAHSQKHRRKFTPEQVARIRTGGESLDLLADEFGVSKEAVHWCRNYFTYKDLP
jgi:hypothetical protein